MDERYGKWWLQALSIGFFGALGSTAERLLSGRWTDIEDLILSAVGVMAVTFLLVIIAMGLKLWPSRAS